jgi:hypothetical protein
MAQRHAARVRVNMARTTKLRGEIEDRLRNHPNQTDKVAPRAMRLHLDQGSVAGTEKIVR